MLWLLALVPIDHIGLLVLLPAVDFTLAFNLVVLVDCNFLRFSLEIRLRRHVWHLGTRFGQLRCHLGLLREESLLFAFDGHGARYFRPEAGG